MISEEANPVKDAFYIAREGQTFGPHDVGEIRVFLDDGLISPQDLLWKEGMERWAPIRELLDAREKKLPAVAETFIPVEEPPPTIDPGPIARASDEGLSRRLAIAAAITVGLHLALLAGMTWGASVFFTLKNDDPTLVSPPPQSLEVTFVSEPDPPPPEDTPPPPPPVDPPPPPAIPDVPIPTDIPPPTPMPMDVPPTESVPLPAPVATPLPKVEAPRPVKIAHRAVAAPTPVPVANQIVDAGPSDYLRAPPPTYPYAARQNHQSGTVVLTVTIDEEGAPVNVNVEQSSGFPLLDRAGSEAGRE